MFGQKGIATSSLLSFLFQVEDICHIIKISARILKQSWEEIHGARDFNLLPGASTELPATWIVILEADPSPSQTLDDYYLR